MKELLGRIQVCTWSVCKWNTSPSQMIKTFQNFHISGFFVMLLLQHQAVLFILVDILGIIRQMIGLLNLKT